MHCFVTPRMLTPKEIDEHYKLHTTPTDVWGTVNAAKRDGRLKIRPDKDKPDADGYEHRMKDFWFHFLDVAGYKDVDDLSGSAAKSPFCSIIPTQSKRDHPAITVPKKRD